MQKGKASMKKMIIRIVAIVMILGMMVGIMPIQHVDAAMQYGVGFYYFKIVNGSYQTIQHGSTQWVEEGKTVTKPSNPSMDGYIFDNWYTSNEFTTVFNFSTPITSTSPRSFYGRFMKELQIVAYDNTAGAVGGGTVSISGSMPIYAGPGSNYTQRLYADANYEFNYTANDGYYFKGWSVNNPNNPTNYEEFTVSPMYLEYTSGGSLNSIYAVFEKYGSDTLIWTAYENKTSEFRYAYTVSSKTGIYAEDLMLLDDPNHIAEIHWEGLTDDGRIPAGGSADFVVTLKDGVDLGSYGMVLTNNVNHKVYDLTINVQHDVLKHLPVEPKCTSTGNIVYWECLECGKYFSDEACLHEVNKDDMHLDALGHDYGDWEYLNTTQHKRYCSRNHNHSETKTHTWDNGVITTQPTTTSTGIKTYTCTGCGGTKTETVPKATALAITKQTEDYYGAEGSRVSITVEAVGTGLKYQWYLSDNNGRTWSKSSLKAPEYYVNLDEARNGRLVKCVVTDAFGDSVTSQEAVMRIATPLVITKQPEDYNGVKGSRASIKVEAEGTGLKYKWYLSNDHGATWSESSLKTNEYRAYLDETRDGRMVKCEVSDSFGNSVTSQAATMRIINKLAITKQPEDYFGVRGSLVSMTVEAEGVGLSYQWYLSNNNGETWSKSSLTGSEYYVDLDEARDGRLVKCVVTDAFGDSVTSRVAKMEITNKLAITKQPQNYTGAKGSRVSITVEATGTGLKYQWYLSDNNGATWGKSSLTGSEYYVELDDARNGRLVKCVITDSYGNTVTSQVAKMSIK